MRTSWKPLPRLRPYLRPYRKLALSSLLLVALSSFLGLLTPWPLKIIVDSVLSGHPLPGPLQQHWDSLGGGRTMLLSIVVAAGLLLVLFQRGLDLVNSYLQTRLGNQMLLDFRSDLFAQAQRLSISYHDEGRSGDVLARITDRSMAIEQVALALLPLTQSLITLVGMFTVAFWLDPQLALLSLIVGPFVYWSIGYYSRRIEPRVRTVRGMEAESLSLAAEAMSILRMIQAFGREAFSHQRFHRHSREALQARVALTVRQSTFAFAVGIIAAAGTSLVIWVGALHVLRGDLTLGLLLVVIAYIGSVYAPLQAISGTLGTLQERLIDLSLAFELLDERPEVEDRQGAVDAEDCRGGIRFESVGFSYRSREPALSEVSFTVEPGELVAVIGPTGAGKTTLAGLLLRFYDPDKGRILLDGRDLRDLRLASLRRQVSLVTQEPLLFSGSVEENIRFGGLEATVEQVIEAAKAAAADDFIGRLPEGYATQISERGARLSVGERQRLSIARAYLKNAPILVLDEPTSAVDVRTEELIMDSLKRLTHRRTTFLITHRLSAARNADKIAVLEKGLLVQFGTHRELEGQGGLYRRFLQSLQRPPAGGAATGPSATDLPTELVIEPASKWPIRLPQESERTIRRLPVPILEGLRGLPRETGCIVVVTLNNLILNKLCLTSLALNTRRPGWQTIVVDNGSSDGTDRLAAQFASERPDFRAILNRRNRGFAAAVNQGIEASAGEYLVLLNSDVVLPPNWLDGLINQLGAPNVGLAGPCTNRCGNEAEIAAEYRTYGEFVEFAAQRRQDLDGRVLELPMLAMFCVALRRRVYHEIGAIDERFGAGLFEDDDYSLRTRQAGYSIVCAQDCYVHHFGHASFAANGGAVEYQNRLEANRRLFEEKWGIEWRPHRRRVDPEYPFLCRRIRDLTASALPESSRVLVVSRGDDALLPQPGFSHFPQDAGGGYAGYHPADGGQAIAALEELRNVGFQYLLFPRTSFWWLDHYSEFRQHLDRYPKVIEDKDAILFRLRPGDAGESEGVG